MLYTFVEKCYNMLDILTKYYFKNLINLNILLQKSFIVNYTNT